MEAAASCKALPCSYRRRQILIGKIRCPIEDRRCELEAIEKLNRSKFKLENRTEYFLLIEEVGFRFHGFGLFLVLGGKRSSWSATPRLERKGVLETKVEEMVVHGGRLFSVELWKLVVSPWFSGQFGLLPSSSFWQCLEMCGCHTLGEGDGDVPGIPGRGGGGGPWMLRNIPQGTGQTHSRERPGAGYP